MRDIDVTGRDSPPSEPEYYRHEKAPTLTELNLEEFAHDDNGFDLVISHYNKVTN